MKPVPKIITAVLTVVYTSITLLVIWSFLHFPDEPIFPWDPIFFSGTGFLGFGLLVFYCNHLAENEDVGRFSRILWFIRFFIVGFIAFPLYWVSFIMRSSPEEIEEE